MENNSLNGQEIRNRNINACFSVFEIIKSSLGPISFDKMIIDQLGEITYTNDGANILKRMEITHPAAKILANLANRQNEEIGDGTTSVILISFELLRRGNDLIKKKIHPSSVISAFRLAMCHSCSLIREKLCIPVQYFRAKTLFNIAKTSLFSKISGFNSKKFALIVTQAIKSVEILEKTGNRRNCQIKSINFVKIHGNTINASCLFDGFGFDHQKLSLNMASRISSCKIICLNFELKKFKHKVGLTVQNKNLNETKKILESEVNSIRYYIEKIIGLGVNLLFTTKTVDDFLVKYLVKNGILVIRRISDDNLRKIAILTGSKIQNILEKHKLEFSNNYNWIGEAEELFEQEIASLEFLFIRGCRFCTGSSIFIRGATDYLLEEIEQSFFDAIFMVKKSIEGNKLITGGGSVESNLFVSLEKLANSILTKEQLGILEFAEALLIIPKTLSSNSGLDHTEIISKMRLLHNAALNKNFEDFRYFGINLLTGKIQNQLINGIFEPAISKIKCIQIATEAAITLLRIDDLVTSNKQ